MNQMVLGRSTEANQLQHFNEHFSMRVRTKVENNDILVEMSAVDLL